MIRQYMQSCIPLCLVMFLTTCCISPANEKIRTRDQLQSHSTQSISQTTTITNLAEQQMATLQITPGATNEPANSQPSQSPSVASINETELQNQASISETEKVDPAIWPIYVDDVYHFRIAYPPYYATNQLNSSELAQFSPQPITAIYFQDKHNPLVDIAPPAFSIRIFENNTQQPLEAWLTQVKLFFPAAGWLSEPYKGKSVTGIKLISPNFIAPGWFVYIMVGPYVFQLTPLGTQAELMLDTFSIKQ